VGPPTFGKEGVTILENVPREVLATSLRCRLLAGWSSGAAPDIFSKVFFRGSMLMEFELVEYVSTGSMYYGGKRQCRKRVWGKGKMKPTIKSDVPFSEWLDTVSLGLGAPRDRASVHSR
jgi:hypothetical protein